MTATQLATLWAAMCLQESSNDPTRINAREQAYGIVQVRRLALLDVNNHYKTNYTLRDMLDPVKARDVWERYLTLWAGPADQCSAERWARIWNGGPRGAEKTATAGYWAGVCRKMDAVARVSVGNAQAKG